MLNKKKTIESTVSFHNVNNYKQFVFGDKFLQVPELAKNNYIQTNQSKNVDLGFPTVFKESVDKQIKGRWEFIRFEYNLKQFKRFYTYQNFKKKTSKGSNFDIRSFFVFLQKVSKRRKKLAYYLLKQIKGGFMISTLGVVCFVPRSLYKDSRRQQIINLKLFQKNFKKFTRPSIKINLVSSLKHRKKP
jgi:hypothetical protein